MQSTLVVALLGAAVLSVLPVCSQAEDAVVGSLAYAATAQQTNQSRVALQLIKPTEVPADHWRTTVVATYGALEQGAKGTTVTTKSRDNCRHPNSGVSIPVPSFSLPTLRKCERTVDREVEVKLQPRQITLADEKTLNIDFDPVIEDGGAKFRVTALRLNLRPCAAACAEIQLTLNLSCYATEREYEMIADQLRVAYTAGAQVDAGATDCGLAKGDWPGWSTPATIQARIRGHFGENDRQLSAELLDSFSAIPTHDHAWLSNPTFEMSKAPNFCSLAADEVINDRVHLQARLGAEQGWPYAPDVGIEVYRRAKGELCAIWIDGEYPHEGLVSRVRHFYAFEDGRLVQARTEEPEQLERTWRYVNDEPMEYIRKQDLDSGAGDDQILYWHALAAKEWPLLMDYSPNMKEFSAQQKFARNLALQFGAAKATQ